ncbi:MAG: heat-shock protein [Meiothermus sp.]
MSLERLDSSYALEQIRTLRRRLEELTRQYASGEPFAQWTPAVDVLDEEQQYRILVDLPGVKPEDLELREEGDTLTLAGIRHAPFHGTYPRQERPMGYFRRTLTLPGPIRAGESEASFKGGVLEIIAHKA